MNDKFYMITLMIQEVSSVNTLKNLFVTSLISFSRTRDDRILNTNYRRCKLLLFLCFSFLQLQLPDQKLELFGTELLERNGKALG